MAKKVDLKAKAKRQKMIAAGGGVLLIAVLAFQVPRTMKMLNAEAPPPAPVAVAPGTTVPSDPSVLPTPGTVGGGASPAASGDGTLVDRPTPVAISGLTTVDQVSTGEAGFHGCAIIADGGLRCWGSNSSGQIGVGDNILRLTPVAPMF